ncbi:MAG: type II toxin-antitoxin system VapC family toxin [Gemmataceae bacterium]|nr:type II toxin-antitoxin system VapC family toxin [Gemmataceae bacterium]MCI0743026.1 type II toxin-antitoxin system VapC family toxin [Gemmataceae bacterium]
MKFLLDANAWIGHMRQTSPSVTHRLRLHAASDIVLCSVVVAELLYGVERSGPAQRPANLRLDLAAKGTPIGPNDLMIAAIALATT